jgi:hypothetical protein
MTRFENGPTNSQIVASLVSSVDGWNEILGATASPEEPKPARKRRNTRPNKAKT